MAVAYSEVPVVYGAAMDRLGDAVVTPVIHLDGEGQSLRATASAPQADECGPNVYVSAMGAAPRMNLSGLRADDLRALVNLLRDVEHMHEMLRWKHQWPVTSHQLQRAEPGKSPTPDPITARALAYPHDSPAPALAEAIAALNTSGVSAALAGAVGVPVAAVAVPIRRGDGCLVLFLAGGEARGAACLTTFHEHMTGMDPVTRAPLRVELTDTVVNHVHTLEHYSLFTRLLDPFVDPPSSLPSDVKQSFDFWCRQPIGIEKP
jgi:hypothetical protein